MTRDRIEKLLLVVAGLETNIDKVWPLFNPGECPSWDGRGSAVMYYDDIRDDLKRQACTELAKLLEPVLRDQLP